MPAFLPCSYSNNNFDLDQTYPIIPGWIKPSSDLFLLANQAAHLFPEIEKLF